MAELKEQQKEWIVTQLACFYSPSEVVEAFLEQFGIKIERQQVNQYNPETAGGREIRDKWKKLFEERREAFVADRSRIAIAQANFRLRELENLYRNNKKKSPIIAMRALEQAAKDAGGLYQRPEIAKPADANDTLPAEFDAAINKIYADPSEATDAPAEPGQ